jgi:hypothetical protein
MFGVEEINSIDLEFAKIRANIFLCITAYITLSLSVVVNCRLWRWRKRIVGHFESILDVENMLSVEVSNAK